MVRISHLLSLLLISAVSAQLARASHAPAPSIFSAADKAGAKDLWPGFQPNQTPLAIYDGERTWLFRHPSPPDGFDEYDTGIQLYVGRHPAVVSNSSASIGGVMTATLMPGPGSALERAGTAVHETFHVFQRLRHPKWSANEVDLFEYPFTDPRVLVGRRLESTALARALRAKAPAESACWAATALFTRAERFGTMPQGASTYERMTELNEGLANYVEARAVGRKDADLLKATPESDGFPPDLVRQRGYASGAALGRLLDRFQPEWRQALEANEAQALDMMLRSALGPQDTTRCRFAAQDLTAAFAAAEKDIAALVARRTEARRAFEAAPGWRIVIEAAAPIWPMNFDPWNVTLLSDTEVLHTRTVKLGDPRGSLEVLGYPTLSVAAGDHPLFQGVKRATIGGLTVEPTVNEEGGVLTLTAPEVKVSFKGATLTRNGKVLYVRF